MQIIHAQESFPNEVTKSIFLAGCTTRDGSPSWRAEALEILEDLGYDGTVFIPEVAGGYNHDFSAQVNWEEEALNRADVILFWVPRNNVLKGLTTNIEWGRWEDSGKVIWAAPVDASNNRYPIHYAKKLKVPGTTDLKQALRWAIEHFLGQGSLRKNGECQIPLHIWKRKDFQEWYQAQTAVGNVLEGAWVVSSLHAPKSNKLFCYTLHVKVWIAKETRSKVNEFVLFRPGISSALLYHGTKVVLSVIRRG